MNKKRNLSLKDCFKNKTLKFKKLNFANSPQVIVPTTSTTPKPSFKLLDLKIKDSFLSFALVAIIFLLVGVTIYKLVFDNKVESYSMSFNSNDIGNISSSLYIDEDWNSYKFLKNDDLTLDLLSSPFQIGFKPQTFLFDKNLNISASIKDEGDWDISMFCSNCSKDSRYIVKPFYRGILKSYKIVKSFGETQVYTKLDNFTQKDTSDDLQTWMVNNIDSNSAVTIMDTSLDTSTIATKLDNIKNGSTTLPYTIRGTQQYYTYLTQDLKLQFNEFNVKGNTNSDSPVTVEVRTANNIVIFNKDITNELTNEDTADSSKVVNVNYTDLPYSGVFKITLRAGSDWLFSNLTINSTKFVIAGTNFIVNPGSLYTQVDRTSSLRLLVTTEDYLQTINISNSNGENKKVEYSRANIGLDTFTLLTPAEYTISFTGGQIMDGFYFAKDKESYFNPFNYQSVFIQDDLPEFIVTDVKMQKEGDNFVASTFFTKDDYLRLDDLTNVKFYLRNPKLDAKYKSDLLNNDNGYTKSVSIGNFTIYSKSNSDLKPVDNQNVAQYVNANIPENSSIFMKGQVPVNQNSFVNTATPTGFKAEIKNFTFDLRGSHDFYVYLSDKLTAEISKMDLNWFDGEDSATVSLTGINSSFKCSSSILDDGNLNNKRKTNFSTLKFDCPNVPKGTYRLSIKENSQTPKNDFLITNIKINTNKFMIKDRVLNNNPQTLYVNSSSTWNLSTYYWWEDKDQTISVIGQAFNQIELMPEDISKTISTTFNEGLSSIVLPKGYVVVRGNNFALTPDGWFDVYKYNFNTSEFLTDYKIQENTYNGDSVINNVTVKFQ